MEISLESRIKLLSDLGIFLEDENNWRSVAERAERENGWFIQPFIREAISNITHCFLKRELLEGWVGKYSVKPNHHRQLGIIMAGNIPLVGFHDFLCGFISGYKILIKPSGQDEVLIKFLINKLGEWQPAVLNTIQFTDGLMKGLDAYIATGSNNSSRYFEYYFRNRQSIIRRNRTSVAILTGLEKQEDLKALCKDIFLYFGRGCRNVTQLIIPANYAWQDLLEQMTAWDWLPENTKYKNNYDYNLSLLLLNNQYYMSPGHLLIVEDNNPFAPIGRLNYRVYYPGENPVDLIPTPEDLQAVEGHFGIEFGAAQSPALADYADGIDTMAFLNPS